MVWCIFSFYQIRYRAYFIIHSDYSGFYYASRNPAMSTNCVIATGAKSFFHKRAGVTEAGIFEYDFANLELFVLERQQVDAADAYITT